MSELNQNFTKVRRELVGTGIMLFVAAGKIALNVDTSDKIDRLVGPFLVVGFIVAGVNAFNLRSILAKGQKKLNLPKGTHLTISLDYIMKLLLLIFIVIATSALGQVSNPAPDPLGVACYEVGDPILMRFSYSGEKDGWDADFNFNIDASPPLISKGARAVFVLSKGTGPFESRVTRDRKTFQQWELLEAPRGKVVVPKNKKFGGNAAYNAVINQPFDRVINLLDFFELEAPGVYTLVWGCRPNFLQEVVFEVLP